MAPEEAPRGHQIRPKWANFLFQVNNKKEYTNDWQGNVNGNPLPKASYLYRVDADSNGSIDYQGWIFLTR